jgi:hypothetical protein
MGGRTPYKVRWIGRNVVNVLCDFKKSKVFRFLCTSDGHWDNLHCNREMFRGHLDEALRLDAGWIDNGDLYCLMQGKWDPRSDMEQLRPEHQSSRYLDVVKDDLARWLAPYSGIALALGHGNHETGIINRHQVDMTERLCATLNARHGSGVRCHGLSGWVVFRCRKNTRAQSIRLFRHHGYGGGAPVTRGVIQTNRLAVQYPDANIILTGHDHNEWIVPIPRKRLTTNGVIHTDEQLHVRVPGYKDGIGDGYEGWENVKGHQVKGQGAMMIELRWTGDHRVDYRVVRMK